MPRTTPDAPVAGAETSFATPVGTDAITSGAKLGAEFLGPSGLLLGGWLDGRGAILCAAEQTTRRLRR